MTYDSLIDWVEREEREKQTLPYEEGLLPSDDEMPWQELREFHWLLCDEWGEQQVEHRTAILFSSKDTVWNGQRAILWKVRGLSRLKKVDDNALLRGYTVGYACDALQDYWIQRDTDCRIVDQTSMHYDVVRWTCTNEDMIPQSRSTMESAGEVYAMCRGDMLSLWLSHTWDAGTIGPEDAGWIGNLRVWS